MARVLVEQALFEKTYSAETFGLPVRLQYKFCIRGERRSASGPGREGAEPIQDEAERDADDERNEGVESGCTGDEPVRRCCVDGGFDAGRNGAGTGCGDGTAGGNGEVDQRYRAYADDEGGAGRYGDGAGWGEGAGGAAGKQGSLERDGRDAERCVGGGPGAGDGKRGRCRGADGFACDPDEGAGDCGVARG